jgi:hypothetical protein
MLHIGCQCPSDWRSQYNYDRLYDSLVLVVFEYKEPITYVVHGKEKALGAASDMPPVSQITTLEGDSMMTIDSGEMSGDDEEKWHDMLGPGHVDRLIRQAIQFCRMGLPKSKRTPDEVERQIRRIVERALRDSREDQQAFSDE